MRDFSSVLEILHTILNVNWYLNGRFIWKSQWFWKWIWEKRCVRWKTWRDADGKMEFLLGKMVWVQNIRNRGQLLVLFRNSYYYSVFLKYSKFKAKTFFNADGKRRKFFLSRLTTNIHNLNKYSKNFLKGPKIQKTFF